MTGIDFSEESIETARTLRDEAGLTADFVCCDVYEVPEAIDREFDIVFASYGIIVWLSDIETWANVVADSLKSGGTFYLVDGHPIAHVFDDDLQIAHSYFRIDPIQDNPEGTYADPNADTDQTVTYQWLHRLSDIVTALTSAGLRIEFLHEFPQSDFKLFDAMHEEDGGFWTPKVNFRSFFRLKPRSHTKPNRPS